MSKLVMTTERVRRKILQKQILNLNRLQNCWWGLGRRPKWRKQIRLKARGGSWTVNGNYGERRFVWVWTRQRVSRLCETVSDEVETPATWLRIWWCTANFRRRFEERWWVDEDEDARWCSTVKEDCFWTEGGEVVELARVIDDEGEAAKGWRRRKLEV